MICIRTSSSLHPVARSEVFIKQKPTSTLSRTGESSGTFCWDNEQQAVQKDLKYSYQYNNSGYYTKHGGEGRWGLTREGLYCCPITQKPILVSLNQCHFKSKGFQDCNPTFGLE